MVIILVSSVGTNIRVWSPAHQLISEFGKKGSQQGEFINICGIAINSTGTIYVVEAYPNKRLQIISQLL